MKNLFLLAILFNLVSCAAIRPEYLVDFARYQERTPASESSIEWDLDPSNKAQMDVFWVHYKDCTDFAFKAKVMGAKGFESDIHTQCLIRKGYKTRKKVASK